MLLNKITKYTIAWVLIGTLCYLSQTEDKPLPGIDFPKPDPTKGMPIGWDFEKKEYRYHEPNPKTMDKVYPKNNPQPSDGEEDPYEALYYYLD